MSDRRDRHYLFALDILNGKNDDAWAILAAPFLTACRFIAP